jgi:hypothetical protein
MDRVEGSTNRAVYTAALKGAVLRRAGLQPAPCLAFAQVPILLSSHNEDGSTLLRSSAPPAPESRCWQDSFLGHERPLYLPGDVSLEASDDFLLGSALACPFGDVVSGSWVPVYSDEGDGVNGFVKLTVASTVQSEPRGAA